jgi:hypothetical protein
MMAYLRFDFHPSARVIAAKLMSSSARSCAAPTPVQCPLTSATNLSSIPLHCVARLKIGARLPGLSAPPDFTLSKRGMLKSEKYRRKKNDTDCV